MRRFLVLALLFALSGCRRSEASPEPEQASATQLPTAPTAPAPTPADPPATPAEPAPAVVREEELPRPVAEAPAPAEETEEARQRREAEEEDRSIYRWTDDQGAIHFGNARDVPDGVRGARKVGGDERVMVVPATKVQLSPTPADPEPAAPTVADEVPARVPDPPLQPQAQPLLDDQGLPIPGTMQDTAHTRLLKRFGAQIDAAAMERAHQEELRRLKCRVVDGATICG